ncbi:MAG TPA: tRNA glutamyl-Q(34) synthetase GluQRS [Thermoanaerobaculia bacterium]|nr:tRNA glutamyl-Q(34) synthetase GluQRS [Thermoanaerobaculia bacterium]
MSHHEVVGRFAPSPTGPLHLGSLVAAVGSWLFARSAGGRWLVRMEDLDTPRVVAGSGQEILAALQRYGLEWDGDVVWQSQRIARYAEALEALRSRGQAYDCACSRADILRAASAPAAGDPVDAEARIYPGTCRNGLEPGARPRAIRFRVPAGVIAFDDLVHGRIKEDVAERTGDFVIRRADGLFAYQLAVVVDDAAQGVTQVVRGGDLLESTPRQIALQRTLGLPEPRYAHLPLVLGADGSKLGKRDGALPLPSLDRDRVTTTLAAALAMLGVKDIGRSTPSRMLAEAVERFQVRAVPRQAVA